MAMLGRRANHSAPPTLTAGSEAALKGPQRSSLACSADHEGYQPWRNGIAEQPARDPFRALGQRLSDRHERAVRLRSQAANSSNVAPPGHEVWTRVQFRKRESNWRPIWHILLMPTPA